MREEKILHAVEALKAGQLIIVADDDNREAEGDLIGLSSKVTPEAVNFMTKNARGLLCVPVTKKIAQRLDLHAMTAENSDAFGTAFTISVDHKETTTGISAFDRAKTIKALADPNSEPSDFLRPGHIFPLIAENAGVLKRRGHTEAAVDLARLAHEESAYICEILKEDGKMARTADLKALARKWQLDFITIAELSDYLTHQKKSADVTVQLPTKYGDFKLSLYLDHEGKEQLVLSMGDLKKSKEPPLIRVHSECLTGDVFGSHRCDCGEQLDQAMKQIAEAKIGAILYLRQEGRGIGLRNKLKAYKLQEAGMDTYEANVALGFLPDERHYAQAAWLLKNEGVSKIKLLTNNPEKIAELQQHHIEIVERVPLETTVYQENKHYLKTKQEKFHHMLSLEKGIKS
ncbi:MULTISPECIES: GTP cyclohydrolase II [Sporolactobacillus]|uniref:GTP cyclohydrolase-2 n=1 Tax=Sporolactobacillus inulinus CASD TaxID=1069536 RepID=A0A0U1QL63_9BACL|nr:MULTISPECIES: GTP cyclohydrolase II [Sporolactobacillus]KLI01533.1 3,4-dihydroxy-2-butanone 4-phosphate synthase [Sporolactobacillus inulinus CASD]GEB77727.1 riboflavin biosynthesis protein RibBA [Sporolactobacillus inulinus]